MRVTYLNRSEWRELYRLRDEAEDPQLRLLLRRLIRYVEGLESRKGVPRGEAE